MIPPSDSWTVSRSRFVFSAKDGDFVAYDNWSRTDRRVIPLHAELTTRPRTVKLTFHFVWCQADQPSKFLAGFISSATPPRSRHLTRAARTPRMEYDATCRRL